MWLHHHSHVDKMKLSTLWWSDGLPNLFKSGQTVILFTGLSGLLATSHSYSKSMNQQAVCIVSTFDDSCSLGQGLEWSWGNQIWSLLKEKVNHCGKPPSHCLSPFSGSGFILSPSLPAERLRGHKSPLNHTVHVSTLEFFLGIKNYLDKVLFLHIDDSINLFWGVL